MPEYLAPGVHVEETSWRARSIEGVSTATTGFIGPTRYGPLDLEPEIVTSLAEFERTYGGQERLVFEDDTVRPPDNHVWHAARAFFEEGGKRLYVSRVFSAAGSPPDLGGAFARHLLGGSPGITVRARFPGCAGRARVRFTFSVGPDVLAAEDPSASPPVPPVRSLQDRDVVLILDAAGPAALPPSARGFFLALRNAGHDTWTFSPSGEDDAGPMLALTDLLPGSAEVRVLTVTVDVDPLAPGAARFTAADLPLDPFHRRGGTPDSLFDAFAPHARDSDDPDARVIATPGLARTVPIVIEFNADMANGIAVLRQLLADPSARAWPPPGLQGAIEDLASTAQARSLSVELSGGNDGVRPRAAAYEGTIDENERKTGLRQFEDLEDISIVAAPGSTFGYETEAYGPQSCAIVRNLIDHAQRMRYRIAVVDSGDNQTVAQVRAMRAQLDSSHAALYYPWIRVLDPLTQRETHLPPSGFVCGIYARNDVNRGVHKAPANEVVKLALGLERLHSEAQQEVLNRQGINCLRFFEGRGTRLWGARTVSSDPQWKYVSLRRYFVYIERSIDKGTSWAVFEPNGETLWAHVRRTIEGFLHNEWRSGALLGDKPEQAWFVRCDRSTMSQNDLDNGRLICLVGVAPLRPAEFVILRVGQWTADRRV